MLTKLTPSARARPSLAASARNSGANGWSDKSSTSAPSIWFASRVSACHTRSAKNATLLTLATAITRASASTRNSPARQSRSSIFSGSGRREGGSNAGFM